MFKSKSNFLALSTAWFNASTLDVCPVPEAKSCLFLASTIVFDLVCFEIFDANITTLIAALILYIIGTGPVKGFAITLSIGIVTSMFTAIMCTRAMVNIVYGNKNITELKI